MSVFKNKQPHLNFNRVDLIKKREYLEASLNEQGKETPENQELAE